MGFTGDLPCRRYLNGRHSGHGTFTEKEVFYDAPHSCVAGAGDIHSSVVCPKHQSSHGSIWLYDRHCRQSHRKHYTDRYGNTTGWVGGKYVSTYNDGYGGTTGTIGNKHITTHEDGYGNTTGTIGRDRINLYTEPSGTTTGTIGRRRLNCYTDRFRTTRCQP